VTDYLVYHNCGCEHIGVIYIDCMLAWLNSNTLASINLVTLHRLG